MFNKIITSGESGVEQAAMDLALRLGIACNGWTPKRPAAWHADFRKKYRLRQTTAVGFQQAVENNVIDADGMLLITRGEKNTKTRYAVKMTLKHQKQLLHVDLQQFSKFEAASLLSSWLQMQHIKTLYITGPSEKEDQAIYGHTQKILETALYLDFVKSGLNQAFREIKPDAASHTAKDYPQTVQEAVARLKTDLSLKDRTLMANMQSDELDRLRDGLGEYIKQRFGLYSGNDRLMQSCAQFAQLKNPLPEEACQVILRSLWNDLQKTHKLRIIK